MRDTGLLPRHPKGGFAWKLAISTGVFRGAAGAAMVTRPEFLPELLGVDSITARRVTWLTRLLAGREAALGLGALHAAATGRPVRPWLLAQALCDATDAAALVLAARARQVSTPRALAVVAFAAAGVACEVLARDE